MPNLPYIIIAILQSNFRVKIFCEQWKLTPNAGWVSAVTVFFKTKQGFICCSLK